MPKPVHYVYALSCAEPVCGDPLAETVTVRESDVTCPDCLLVLTRPRKPSGVQERVPTPEERHG